MELVVTDRKQMDEQKEKFIQYILTLTNIFSPTEREIRRQHLLNLIGEVYVNTDLDLMKEEINEIDYTDNKTLNGKYKIKYNACGDYLKDNFRAIHALGHVLLTPSRDYFLRYNKCMPYQGPCKIELAKGNFYGLSVSEGLVNMLTKIACLKNVNVKMVENYMENGGCDFKTDEHFVFENIARLLTLASTNFYSNEPAKLFSECVTQEKGIDFKNEEVLSTFISSSINNDFSFENEFDFFLGKGKCKKMFENLDKVYEAIKNDDSYSEYPVISSIENIRDYYCLKLDYLFSKGFVSNIKKSQLLNSFNSVSLNFEKQIPSIYNNEKVF